LVFCRELWQVPFSWVLASLCLLAGLSHLISIWQLLAALAFPLHRRVAAAGFAPGVSVFKPLKGTDAQAADCLRSWLQQDYAGPVQVLFGVREAGDPACDVVRSLLAEFPQHDARLVLCPEQPGTNAKVCTLIQLEPLARHEILLVSDADVKVPPDFLAQFLQPLRDPAHGMVNSLYAQANPVTPAQQWEAVTTNADFWSQVLQSRTLKPQDFALGAAMAVRRGLLEQLGGFRALRDHLADDYQLGRRVHQLGKLIALSPVVVECWDPPSGWMQIWAHQLRWARTVRVCQPAPYAASIISNVTLWTTAAMLAGQHQPLVLLAGSVVLGLRIAFAKGLAERLRGWSPGFLASLWLVPLRDLLSAVIWSLAFLGDTIHWRGVRYQVLRDGTLRRRDK